MVSTQKIKGQYPRPVEADHLGRIYEQYSMIDTVDGKIYDRILRRKIPGGLDTNYAVRILRSRVGSPYVYYQKEIFVDSLGRLLEYLGDGKYYPEIENYEPWMGIFRQYLSGGRYRRYDADRGSTFDTIYIVPGTIELQHHNERILLGADPENNRWTYTRNAGGGIQPIIRQTEFGANGLVRKVLSDTEGRAIILGDFTYFDGLRSPRVARIKKDGRVDSSFRCATFGAKEAGENVGFSFWRNDPAKGLLVVNSKPFGSLNRYLYHVLPDGKIDTGYASSFPGLPGDTVFDVLSAAQVESGSVFITFRLRKQSDTSKSYLLKLLPDGHKDPGFPVQPIEHYFPAATHPNYFWGPFLREVRKMGPNRLLLGRLRKWYWEDPPCDQPESSTEFREWKGIAIDTTGMVITDTANGADLPFCSISTT